MQSYRNEWCSLIEGRFGDQLPWHNINEVHSIAICAKFYKKIFFVFSPQCQILKALSLGGKKKIQMWRFPKSWIENKLNSGNCCGATGQEIENRTVESPPDCYVDFIAVRPIYNQWKYKGNPQTQQNIIGMWEKQRSREFDVRSLNGSLLLCLWQTGWCKCPLMGACVSSFLLTAQPPTNTNYFWIMCKNSKISRCKVQQIWNGISRWLHTTAPN